jgi:hypothetical protein
MKGSPHLLSQITEGGENAVQKYTFLAPAKDVPIYALKLFRRNIWNFLTNIFF